MTYAKYLPLTLFSACAIKLLLGNADLAVVGALAVLGTVSVLFEFKNHSTLLSDIQQSNSQLHETMEQIKKEHETLKTHVAGLKISREIRQVR